MTEKEYNYNFIQETLNECGNEDEFIWKVLSMIESSYKSGLIQAEIDNTMGVIEENSRLQQKIELLQQELNEYKFPDCKTKDIEVVRLNLIDMIRKNKRLQQENERLNSLWNTDKENWNEIMAEQEQTIKSLKGNCKVLGEKVNNQRKELIFLNKKISSLQKKLKDSKPSLYTNCEWEDLLEYQDKTYIGLDRFEDLKHIIQKLTAESTEWESKYYDLQAEIHNLKNDKPKVRDIESYKKDIYDELTDQKKLEWLYSMSKRLCLVDEQISSLSKLMEEDDDLL